MTGEQSADDTDNSTPGSAHAYCHDCDWYATPDDHEYADVMTATEAHTTFERGHTATIGVSEKTVEEARERADGVVSS